MPVQSKEFGQIWAGKEAGENNLPVKLPKTKAVDGTPAEVNLSCKANFRVIEEAHEAVLSQL